LHGLARCERRQLKVTQPRWRAPAGSGSIDQDANIQVLSDERPSKRGSPSTTASRVSGTTSSAALAVLTNPRATWSMAR
jgi:hypothetical protein